MNIWLSSTWQESSPVTQDNAHKFIWRLALIGLIVPSVNWTITAQFPSLVVALAAIFILVLALQLAPRKISLWLAVSLTAHVTFGMALNGYAWQHFDDVFHLVCVGWLTYLVMQTICDRIVARELVLTNTEKITLGVVFSLGSGGAWELFEWFIDMTGAYRAQQDLVDTMSDLLLGSIGGLSATLLRLTWPDCRFQKSRQPLSGRRHTP